MKRTHIKVSVRGLLRQSDAEIRRIMPDILKDGKPCRSVGEVREAMADLLKEGVEVLPVGDPCEGFDYSGGGCPGHEMPDSEGPD